MNIIDRNFYRLLRSGALGTDEEIRMNLLYLLFANYYPKMAYVAYKRWEERKDARERA